MVGDYAHNFTLCSDLILKGMRDQTQIIDYIGNYIESVTLNSGSRSVVLSCIDTIPRYDTLSPYSRNEKPIIKLEFLNLPILPKYATITDYQINIKFIRTPPIDYVLAYDVMFVDDPNYVTLLEKERFSISYLSQQTRKSSKAINVLHEMGKLTVV